MLPVEPEVGTPVTEDVEERLPPGFGGCGNEAMLIVRRRDLSGLLGARPLDAERTVLRFDVELEFERGDRRDGLGLDGVRNFDGWYGDTALGVSAAGRLLLGLGFGSCGNEPDGGLVTGRDG